MSRRYPSYVLLLVVCYLSALCLKCAQGEGCVRVRPEMMNYLVAAPQTPNPPLTNCVALYGSKSCCTSAYTDLITAKQDPIHTKLVNGFLRNLSPLCNQTFDELACLYCSPETSTFINPLAGNTNDIVHICESFCDRIYAACGDAVLVGTVSQTVSAAFPNGKEFCNGNAWFQPFIPLVQSGDSQCFDSKARPCTADDYEGHYTACVNNLRDYIYSWKLDEQGKLTCSGGVALPNKKVGLRCDLACGPGYYLPGGETTCAPCEAGTFSIGGGESFANWPEAGGWPSLPDDGLSFSTYCQDTRTGASGVCAGWEKHGAYITSGDNQRSHGIESILELDVVLIEAGSISFIAEVDSEPGFDGLRFELSPTEKVEIPITGQLSTYTFNLTKGPHLLRWVYYKDDLWSNGEDMAIITVIQVEGIRYADEHCSKCPPGTFQAEQGKDSCGKCSFSNIPSTDATTCVSCSPVEYSFPGDATCKPRPVCTTDDYEVQYSDCRDPQRLIRDKSYVWIAPQYCIDTNHILPPTVQVPCEPCNPGEYRSGNLKCRYCPEGYSNPGGLNITGCTQCLPGFAATKQQTFTTFEKTLPSNWLTACDRCTSEGWQAHYDTIDSGEGDGLFTSWLEIRDTWYTKGSINLTLSFECPASDCSLTLWVNDDLYYHVFSTGNNAKLLNWDVPISPGNHSVYLDFSRWVPWLNTHDHKGTRAILHSLFLVGTTTGGAAECAECPEGTTTFTGDSTVCQPCAPGKALDKTTHRCVQCPVDTFADKPGMKECLSCGPGTSTKGQRGATDCDNNSCTFSYTNTAWPVSFNFSALMRVDAMWGPILDPVNQHSYWLNICTRDHVNNTCRNADGTFMATFACQIIQTGASKDLGRVMGYYYNPPTDMGEEQVVIAYDHGTPCIKSTSRDLAYMPTDRSLPELKKMRSALEVERRDWQRRDTITVERKTNVTLICDPTAGLGYPQAPPAGIEDPLDRCLYDFVWYSLYACHLCTENDYDFYYTPCVNGLHTKVYAWKYSPRRCWGGISTLPSDQVESCTPSTKLCGDGEYVSPKNSSCTPCPPGNYSIGGGSLTQWWSNSLTGFVTYCENDAGGIEANCRGGWVPNGSNIKAKGATGSNAAVLSAERNFIREGTVFFEFSLLTDNGEPLSFWMDDHLLEIWNHTTIQGRATYQLSRVPKGTHVFKWKYAPFVADDKPRIAEIWKVIFNGTSFSESSCSPCQGRTVQENAGGYLCHLCPLNSVYDDNPYKCNACPDGTYALPGEQTCTQQQPCTEEDYYELYSTCEGGKRGTYWMPYLPSLCHGGIGLPVGREGLSCECPLGYHLVNDKCETCPTGKHHNGITCVSAEPGNAIMKVKEFLSTAQGTSVQPSNSRAVGDYQFITGCAGECGNFGWRFIGSAMDSGVHNGTSYSWVYFNATLDVDGEISFTVDLSTHHLLGPNVALEFYIDNVAQNLVRQASPVTVHYPVSAGQHRFLWVHYQEAHVPTTSGSPDTTLQDVLQLSKVWQIRVFGAREGGNVQRVCEAGWMGDGTSQCRPCTAGYFSAIPKQSQCTPCQKGTFTDDEMSTGCTPCGYGTYPNKAEAATACVTSCVFEVNSTTPEGTTTPLPYRFDLSPFRKVPVIAVPSPSTQWASKYTIQICDKMKADQATNPCSEATFVCEESDSLRRNFDAGSLLTFIPNTADDDVKPYEGFVMEYSMGSSAYCAGKERRSILHFTCKMGATPYTVFKMDYAHKAAEAKACEYHFLVETEYACPICEMDRDIRVVNGECLEGKREIKYESIIPCVNPPQSVMEDCSNIEVNEFAILVIAIGVALIVAALIVVAIYFWNKKRQFAQKYELLVAESQAPLEMQEVDREE